MLSGHYQHDTAPDALKSTSGTRDLPGDVTLFAPEYREHQFGLKTTLEVFKEDIAYLRAGFPDLHLTIEDSIADADTVWIRMTARGTNLGPFIGPPTGKPMTITVMDVCRFENGKIVEHWGVPDRFAVMAQLGLLPQPAGEKV